ncbi:MAG: phospholipase C, phosphocholine-specific [Sphingomonadales bacterium]|nr:phospholipase C, phosphocholine-specific [Sphingomonadales bacterium]
MTNRRDLLRGGVFLGGVAGLSGLLPQAVQRAYAITPDPGTTYLDAEHIVILMQENRSFDHMFGTLQGVRGFNDPRPLRQADGVSVFFQRDRAGAAYAPWRLDVKASCVSWMGSIPHGRTDQVDAWNGGLHDNWIEAKRSGKKEYGHIPLTMGYCTRDDLPFYYALADAFTICDQNYSSILSMTTPNRLMLWNGTVREPHESGSLVHMYNHMTHPGGLTWTSFGERLGQAGVSWKCYQNQIYCESPVWGEAADDWVGNDGDNPLERFSSYATAFTPKYRAYVENLIDRALANIEAREATLKEAFARAPTSALQATLRAYADQRARLAAKRTAARRTLADCTPEQLELRAHGLAMNEGDPDYLTLETLDYVADSERRQIDVPKGDVLHQFRKDVATGNLPTVSWLVAPANFSFHPGTPWFGEWYVSEVMNILTERPEVWKKTIFILTFDENDGFFDHAPTYVAADPARPETGRASAGIDTGVEYSSIEDDLIQGIPEQDARAAPFGLGYRVPMIVASPWSRGGWVNSQLSDHTSVIRFVQNFVAGKFGEQIVETNISDWRRTICGDLTSCFRTHDRRAAKLPFLDRKRHLQAIARARHKPLPGGYSGLTPTELAELSAAPERLHAVLWQERGVRPACAVPYELYADGGIASDTGQFLLRMKAGNELFGSRSAGAPFNVYLYDAKRGSQAHARPVMSAQMMAMTFTVRAGDELEEEIDLATFVSGRYDIAIHGPNGFYRHFTGGPDDPAVDVRCEYHRNSRSQRAEALALHLSNRANKPTDIAIDARSYSRYSKRLLLGAMERRTILLDIGRSLQWYDFTVRAGGGEGFSRRYAGHVETGDASFTDPAMGLASAEGSRFY